MRLRLCGWSKTSRIVCTPGPAARPPYPPFCDSADSIGKALYSEVILTDAVLSRSSHRSVRGGVGSQGHNPFAHIQSAGLVLNRRPGIRKTGIFCATPPTGTFLTTYRVYRMVISRSLFLELMFPRSREIEPPVVATSRGHSLDCSHEACCVAGKTLSARIDLGWRRRKFCALF